MSLRKVPWSSLWRLAAATIDGKSFNPLRTDFFPTMYFNTPGRDYFGGIFFFFAFYIFVMP